MIILIIIIINGKFCFLLAMTAGITNVPFVVSVLVHIYINICECVLRDGTSKYANYAKYANFKWKFPFVLLVRLALMFANIPF